MKLFPIVIGLISAGLFGVATPMSKSLLDSLNPLQLAGLLYLGACLGLAPYQMIKKTQQVRLNGKNVRNIAGAIICGGLLGPVFLLWGLSYASSSSVSIWLNLELFATAILGHFFFRDHLGRAGWLGVLLGFLAGVLLTFNEGAAGVLAGSLVAMACLCWGFDNHFTALIDGITPAQSTIVKGLFAGSINFAIGCCMGGVFPSAPVLVAALAVGAFSYGISIMLYIMSAQNIGAVRSQIIFSSAPFWGLLFAILLLHESISGLQIGAALLLVISISLIMIESHSHEHEHSSEEHIHLHRHDDNHHHHTHGSHSPSLTHVHLHSHEAAIHSHKHLPDIHHRHEHHQKQPA